MKDLELVVGKDSTWSIRALLCMRMVGLNPNLTIINLFSDEEIVKLKQLSETALVPILGIGSHSVYDSLAIAEYVNEISSGKLFPTDQIERARSRSMCAELHSGFINLRTVFPFTFMPQSTPEITEDLKSELDRVTEIWSDHKGVFMYSNSGAVDAFYSVLAYRLHIYGIELKGSAGEYQKSLLEWELFASIIEEAKAW